MNKKMSLNIDFQFMKDKLSFMKNTSFHEAIVTIMAVGENDNATFFTKESVEKALWSIKNIPLVGLFKEDENNFGDHEPVYEVRDGVMDMHFNTTPFGVVHESAKQWFEMIEENGIRKEYLVSECLLWKRQKGYELLKEKGQFSVSMEIEVTDGLYNEDTQVYEINDFIFTAIAILGDGVQPCFNSASVKLFSKDLDYKDMMADVEQFSKDLLKFEKEGENMGEMDKVEEVVDEVDEASEVVEKQDVTEEVVVDEQQFELQHEKDVEVFAIPTMDELIQAGIQAEQVDTVMDLLEEISKVQALGIDVEAILAKFNPQDVKPIPPMEVPFVEEGQAETTEVLPEEDVKTLLEKAVNATTTDEILNIFEQIMAIAGLGEVDIRTLFSKETEVKKELEEKLLATVTEFEKMKVEYGRLVEFEKSILAEQKKHEVEELFNKFSTLEGFEGFDELKEKAFEMELNVLEQQLFELLGKKSFSLIQPQETTAPMSVVFEKVEKPMVHGVGVLDKFLIKK